MVLKELILTVSTLGGGSGGLERIDFNSVYFGEPLMPPTLSYVQTTLGRKWWS